MSKVLIFTTDGVGGAERVSVTIGKILRAHDYEVVFAVVRHGTSNSTITDFIPQGFSIICIDDIGPVKMAFKLIRTISEVRPDYVFASLMYLSTKILPFRFRFPKIKFIIRSENNMGMFNLRQRWQMRLSYRLADRIIAQNREMKEGMMNVLGIPETKITVLHNPVDTQYIDEKVKGAVSPYPAGESPVFVASGRFAHQKGFDVLAKAFVQVTDRLPGAHLYILGDTGCENGVVYRQVMDVAVAGGIQDRIHCPGFKSNPYPFIKYADCFVLSSRTEGLPNVLVEAQYLNVPAAATTCIPIIKEIITDGVNGYWADVDDASSLAEAMMKGAGLGKVTSTYKPSTEMEFVDMFR